MDLNNFKEFDSDYNVMVVHPSLYRCFFPTKWDSFWMGFDAIFDAIYFRFTLEDNIDRCAFFECLSKGWYEMYVWDDEEWTFLCS